MCTLPKRTNTVQILYIYCTYDGEGGFMRWFIVRYEVCCFVACQCVSGRVIFRAGKSARPSDSFFPAGFFQQCNTLLSCSATHPGPSGHPSPRGDGCAVHSYVFFTHNKLSLRPLPRHPLFERGARRAGCVALLECRGCVVREVQKQRGSLCGASSFRMMFSKMYFGRDQSGRSLRKAMPEVMVPSRLMRLRAASLSAEWVVW